MEAGAVSHILTEITRWRSTLASLPPAQSEAEAIDRITALEELTSAAAAAQARETLTFDMHRRNREAAHGVPARKQGAGVGAEIGLARKASRARGSALLGFARTLLLDLPCTYTALKAGHVSEEKARIVAQETSWLPREKRHLIDQQIAERLDQGVGVRRLGNEVRALAQQADQKAAVAHLEKSQEERRVTLRPAPGNMAHLSALLPLPQAVAVYTNLAQSAQSIVGVGDSEARTRHQVTADLLVERVTGQANADTVPTEIHLIMTDAALLSDGETPAWLPGFGPLPADIARRFVACNEAEVFIRRLFTRPADGHLVGMESRRREFTGLLRRMIVFRDDACRTPFCDAPITQADHVTPVAAGGATSWENSSGLCASCNLVKENPGWTHRAVGDTLVVRTPTGHSYEVRTTPIGPLRPVLESPRSVIEVRFGETYEQYRSSA